EKMQKIADIRYAAALLQWDQETYMPKKGADFRSRQVATLSEFAHQKFTDKSLGDLIRTLSFSGELPEKERANVKLSLEDYERSTRLTPAFVREMAETVSESFNAWIRAREENNFTIFAPSLAKLVNLKRKEAELLGFKAHPYDALLNEFERGCTVELLDGIFNQLREPLNQLIKKIAASEQVDDSFLFQHFPKDEQWKFGMELLAEFGYDLEAGRQDISEHPFTVSFNNKDVRVTTRIDEFNFNNMTWSCIHEIGHALYEQGLPEEEYGLPLGEAASLGIHESQSRLWENNVGRSIAFWEYYYPRLKKYFPRQLGEIDLSQFYKAINKVQPSLIRTEADEVTYHFHVMIRYELEKKLIAGEIEVNDIRDYWNDQYLTYLGVQVPDDKSGCLQDVHWSHGSFGYFPTYSLGSFYAAQFFNKAQDVLPGLNNMISSGNLRVLLEWLRVNIHVHGRMFTSEELCRRICGEGLNTTYFMDYIHNKYGRIYVI
ncbi:MAG TPA: carboxypeptidase M32, partial [Parasegetibacter sp.]